jgi:hypothetical protein
MHEYMLILMLQAPAAHCMVAEPGSERGLRRAHPGPADGPTVRARVPISLILYDSHIIRKWTFGDAADWSGAADRRKTPAEAGVALILPFCVLFAFGAVLWVQGRCGE